MKKLAVIAALSAALLSGCAADGSLYRSDTYQAGQVNQQQQVAAVEIIALLPGRVAVDNTTERSDSRNVGAIVGALAGLVVGNQVEHSNTARLTGGAVGGVLGGMAGQTAAGSAQKLVDGVQITFRRDGKVFNSAQVGQLCEYKLGAAVLVSSKANETRVQPNNPNGCAKSK